MDEYIEREALKERFRKRIKRLEKDTHDQYSLGLFHGCEYDADLINEPPAADVVPVRHGRWLSWEDQFNKTPKRKNNLGVFCDKCHKHNDNRTDYCPNCGAKMDGGAD